MSGFIKYVLPFAVCLVASLIGYLPFNIGVWGVIRIDFTMIVLFYWFSLRDDSVPFWFVLLLGTLVDVLSNTTLGVHTIAYLSIYFIILYTVEQKVFSSMFGWYMSGLVGIGVAYAIIWLGAIIKDFNAVYDSSYMFSALVTIGLFPILIYIFNKFLKTME